MAMRTELARTRKWRNDTEEPHVRAIGISYLADWGGRTSGVGALTTGTGGPWRIAARCAQTPLAGLIYATEIITVQHGPTRATGFLELTPLTIRQEPLQEPGARAPAPP